jgi:cyclohexanone monooxygenase
VESIDYSYSFSPEMEQEWSWSERYAGQAEILRYIEHVAERFDLMRDVALETRVVAAHFDEAASRWEVVTERGERVSARFCVMATGCLSVPQAPAGPGLERFEGNWYQTARWPHDAVDFSGQRVGVIGTGSSAIQAIPVIAEQAVKLTVFQRTPNYSVPARNAPMDPERERWVKANYAELRRRNRESRVGYVVPVSEKPALDVSAEERERAFAARWERGGLGFGSAFPDLTTRVEANETAAAFIRAKIRGIVRDPATAEALMPKDYPLGTKRICVDSGYYETFNREHVRLVDLREEPIAEITARGVRTARAEYALDSIVFAIGFDAMTGALLGIDIRGRDGVELRETWADGPVSYLGLAVAGFPNLFTITGPGSPSVLSNMMVSIEQHVDWIADCLAYMRERGLRVIEATDEAEAGWVEHANEVANGTLFPRARSWYTGANIAGKPFGFMPYVGGVGAYRAMCDEVAGKGYNGFAMR